METPKKNGSTSVQGDWKTSIHENDSKTKYGGVNERDMIGYGKTAVTPRWPRSAKVALNFVIHYEEGGEMSVLHGDNTNETEITDLGPNVTGKPDERDLTIESMFDYGARCGFWRLHRLFKSRNIPATVWGVGMALERNMEVVGAIKQSEDWEVSSAGYRRWDYKDVSEEVEKEHIDRAVSIHKKLFGKHPAGLYQGKPSMNTRRLAIEEGGFLYDSDAYNDDLPYWTFEHGEEGHPHLIIPYSLVENDMLYTTPNGWAQPEDFLKHLKRTLDYLVLEGRAGQPKMMTVGLHCRLSRPGRVAALAEFVDYAKSYGRECWITTRESIANHWYEHQMPIGCGSPIMAAKEAMAKKKENGAPESDEAAATASSRFSFLGNLSAPRKADGTATPNGTPRKFQSVSDSEEEEESEEPDVI